MHPTIRSTTLYEGFFSIQDLPLSYLEQRPTDDADQLFRRYDPVGNLWGPTAAGELSLIVSTQPPSQLR